MRLNRYQVTVKTTDGKTLTNIIRAHSEAKVREAVLAKFPGATVTINPAR